MTDRNLIVAIKKCIAATFNEARWIELAYLTDGHDLINSHPRLLRSLSWNDDDYESHIFPVVEALIARSPGNLQIIVEYIDLQDWLEDRDPQLLQTLFGDISEILKHAERVSIANSFELNRHIARIRSAIESDPELAIGSTKEMLEAVLKTILEASGDLVGKDEMPKLLKRVQKVLQLDPGEIEGSARGADVVRRTLSNLGQIVDGIDQLRNLYGTGHGRTRHSGITSRHARLVVSSGAALAVFLMETYEFRARRP